jgi:hypothetical protein
MLPTPSAVPLGRGLYTGDQQAVNGLPKVNCRAAAKEKSTLANLCEMTTEQSTVHRFLLNALAGSAAPFEPGSSVAPEKYSKIFCAAWGNSPPQCALLVKAEKGGHVIAHKPPASKVTVTRKGEC